MNNAELISMVRSIAKHGADWRINEVLNRAADALEAAEKRIAELEAQLPKEGEWIDADGANVPLDKDGDTTDSCYCSICGDWLTASDEYAARGWFCPNCGAKMKTVTDCHTLEDGER